jgi:hypothetical protein
MKSPLHSATLLLSEFARIPFGPLASCGRWTTILLFSAILFLPLAAEAGLPRVAISIPTDQSVAAGLKTAEQCDVPGKLIVLPPLTFDFAGRESPASFSEEQTLQGAREVVEIWLHVVVEAGSLDGKESEQQITERVDAFVQRVDAFVKSIPLSPDVVRGVFVEIKGPLSAPDLLAFGLVRLALAVKGNNAGLRLAFVFPPGFVAGHGDIVRRLANYSDLLGINYGPGWRQDAAWIGEHAFNKPVILKSDTGPQRRARHS